VVLGVKKTQLEHSGLQRKSKPELNILLREKITAEHKERNTSYVLLSKNKPLNIAINK